MKQLCIPLLALLLILAGCGQNPPTVPPGSDNQKPTATLTVTTTDTKRGIKATVSASDPDGDPLTYAWNFGDGSTASGKTAQEHSYATDGTYTVKVTVSDGTASVSASNKITVSFSEEPTEEPPANRAPSVTLLIETLEAKRTIRTIATASDPDGDTLSYRWAFGDGETATGNSSRTHSYDESDTYIVTVTVSDGDLEAQDSVSITVQHLRPPDTPDVIIIAFSGRCGLACGAPFTNEAYLDDPNYGTLPALGNSIAESGAIVAGYSFAANVSIAYSDESVPVEQAYGYYEAQLLLDDIERELISDFDNPTRLVLLAHSHGTVWASLLAMENPEMLFDYFIYLDGVCNRWEEDNLDHGTYGNVIQDFYNFIGEPYPSTLAIFGGACNVYSIPGQDLYHIKDVVPNNVLYGVEVHSDYNVVSLPDDVQPTSIHTLADCNGIGWATGDKNRNLRPDGTTAGIFFYKAVGEDHCEIAEPGSAALSWVLDVVQYSTPGSSTITDGGETGSFELKSGFALK